MLTIEIPCLVCVTPQGGGFAVELRRATSITVIDTHASLAAAEAQAKSIARKLSAMLDVAQELLV